MKHYAHLTEVQKEKLFYIQPSEFDKNTPMGELGYALGATLYIPATHDKLFEYLMTKKYISLSSLVICLEDAIGDNQVKEAETKLLNTAHKLTQALENKEITETELPLLFVRTRSTDQLQRLTQSKELLGLLTGFSLPKFNSLDGMSQLSIIRQANQKFNLHLYAMPILETKEIMHLTSSLKELQELEHICMENKDLILNVRIGATDFTSLFGIRRSIDATIYDIAVIRDCIGRIINMFGQVDTHSFVISGPVWEFFSNNSRVLKPELREAIFANTQHPELRQQMLDKAEDGLIKEIVLDKVNGLSGKTIIHPTHITFVNALQVVTREEYEDALQILGNSADVGVYKSLSANKMNEVKPHTNWALKIMKRATIYGVLNEKVKYTSLF